MAGGKETPRQKMIGMMYLVLLAMLAMNMSKQVLNAFVTINDKLVVSENAIIAKTDGTYSLFDAKMALPENKKIVQPWLDRAHQVKDLADGLNNFLVSECSEMIERVEKKPWHEADERGVMHLLPLMAINGKDNYDAPTSMFAIIGSSEKRGQELRNSIHRYRDSICYIMGTYKEGKKNWSFAAPFDGTSMVEYDLHSTLTSTEALDIALLKCNPADTMKIANVYKALSQPAHYENHHEEYSWELTMFDHAPIVAAAAMFTAFIVDVRNAESQAVDFLYGKVEVPVFNFNKIEPLAFAPASYINQGDSIPLSVMIAAYDSTETPIIRYGIDADTADPAKWKQVTGKIGISGDTPGQHKAKGVIMVKQKGELVPKPWEFSYSVGAPMGVVSLPDMNVLYKGYDNVVMGTASGFPSDRVSLSGSNCKISKKGKGYVARVSSGKTASISVMGKKEDGSSVNLGKFEFRVKNLPPPSIYLGGLEDGATVSKANIKAQTKLFAKYDPSIPLNVTFSIKSWSLSVTGAPREVKGTGSNLSPQAKALIKGVQKGGTVSFMVQVKGPDGVSRKKSGSFKVK